MGRIYMIYLLLHYRDFKVFPSLVPQISSSGSKVPETFGVLGLIILSSSKSHRTLWLNVIMSAERRKNVALTQKLDAHYSTLCLLTVAEKFMFSSFFLWSESSDICSNMIYVTMKSEKLLIQENKIGETKRNYILVAFSRTDIIF